MRKSRTSQGIKRKASNVEKEKKTLGTEGVGTIVNRLHILLRPQYQIDKRSLTAEHGSAAGSGHPSQRVMVRTCNGLELRDSSLYAEASASELLESSVLFPSLNSRDELNPRFM
jgi:hypothetical protein